MVENGVGTVSSLQGVERRSNLKLSGTMVRDCFTAVRNDGDNLIKNYELRENRVTQK